MRINIEVCTDIELLRHEALRLKSLVEGFVVEKKRQHRVLTAVDDATEPLKGSIRTTHPDNFKSGWNEAMEYVRKAIESTKQDN